MIDDKAELKRRVLNKYIERGWSLATIERVALRKGLTLPIIEPKPSDPQESYPDPAMYDPMTVTDWSLAMAIAWICWRTPAAVQRCWNAFRGEHLTWTYYNYSGWVLKPWGFMSLDRMSYYEATESPPIMSLTAGRQSLWEALTHDEMKATAVEATTGKVLQVAPFEWSKLEPTIHREDQATDCLSDRHTPTKEKYRDLTLLRRDVVSVWPEVFVPASAKRRTSRQNVIAAVAELINKNPTAPQGQADALAVKLGANRDSVRAAWKLAREKQGKPAKVGRPRKK
ncbi:hypothetical protein [Nitrobacter vulgaris]|nr:hypothetical protein [Nitrobacter vulgaris]